MASSRKPFPGVHGLRNIQRFMRMRNPSIERREIEELIPDQILKRLDDSGFIAGPAKTPPTK
jgi:hypothetical protein